MATNDPKDPKYERCPKARRYQKKQDRFEKRSRKGMSGNAANIWLAVLYGATVFPFMVMRSFMALVSLLGLYGKPGLIGAVVVALAGGFVLCILAGVDYNRWMPHYCWYKERLAKSAAWSADHPDIGYAEAMWAMYELPRRLKDGGKDVGEDAYRKYVNEYLVEKPLLTSIKEAKPLCLLLVAAVSVLTLPVLIGAFLA